MTVLWVHGLFYGFSLQGFIFISKVVGFVVGKVAQRFSFDRFLSVVYRLTKVLYSFIHRDDVGSGSVHLVFIHQ
jgi:hypothetical protein